MSEEGSGAKGKGLAVPSKTIMPPFAALRAFDAVARLGGIRAAALTLQIDHTVVSRHVRALEAWLGLALIERLPGGIALTPEGHRYHSAIAPAIDGIATATLGLLKDKENDRLQIWCMPGFAFQWLMPRIGALERAHPHIAIEVRPTDHPPELLRHEADVDIRYAAIYDPAPDLHAAVRSIKLAEPRVFPVASPAYLAGLPAIVHARDLLDHQLLHEESFLNWQAWLSCHDVEDIPLMRGPRLWHGHLTVDAAKRSRGIALVNGFLVADALRTGELVEVGDGMFQPISLGAYYLYARAQRWNAEPIAIFRNWLCGELEGAHCA